MSLTDCSLLTAFTQKPLGDRVRPQRQLASLGNAAFVLGRGSPAGRVTFFDGTRRLGTVTVKPLANPGEGSARLATLLGRGTHTLRAVWPNSPAGRSPTHALRLVPSPTPPPPPWPP
jgi:hypothetical protein